MTDLHILPVRGGSDPSSVLLLLHGLGSNEVSIAPLAEGADARLEVISIRAPLKVGPSAFAWYPTQFGPEGPVIDAAEAEKGRRQLLEFLERFSAQQRTQKLFLMGFSQGCIMSVIAALSAPSLVQAVVGFSGRLPREFESGIATPDELRRTRVWLGHGLDDRTLPVSLARNAVDSMQRLGVSSVLTEYPAAHQITAGMLSDGHAWLTSVLDEAQPDRHS